MCESIVYSMEDVLTHIMCRALGLAYNTQEKSTIIDSLQKHIPPCFGVFTTVYRAQKIDTWPGDVHGCMGFWNPDFSSMSPRQIYTQTSKVSYKATWKDNRRHHFRKPLYEDAYSSYHVQYMLEPIYHVDTTTGWIPELEIPYNHESFGLIVQDTDGRRATYLPKVFENTTWKDIQERLMKKADVSTPSYTCYAYTTQVFTMPLYKLFRKSYLAFLLTSYVQATEKHYNTFVPYQFHDSQAIISRSQDVRNLATIADMAILSNLLHKLSDTRNMLHKVRFGKSFRDRINDNLEFYLEAYLHHPKKHRQASAFLILALHELTRSKTHSHHIIETICNSLYDQLDVLEPRFELGEVLMALQRVCPKPKLLNTQQHKMYAHLISEGPHFKKDDIFEYNWQAKFLNSLYKKPQASIKKHAKLLHERVMRLTYKLSIVSETNYLAVGFEALCALCPIYRTRKTWNHIFKLFYLLQKRYKHGFYAFKDGSIRLDITGHVNQGLITLLPTLQNALNIRT